MTLEQIVSMVFETVECGCCPIDMEACRKVAKFVRSQYTDVEIQDDEVGQRIRTMMDDLYNYEIFTRRPSERAG